MNISPNNKAILIVIDGEVACKEKLFCAYADGLGFPSYFSSNWDSFEECLNDLDWLAYEVVLIYHKNWQSNLMNSDNTYIDIIESAAGQRDSKLIILYD